MAETRATLYRTLIALTVTAALAGCAATHIGDDWQCPLAQGEVCTSIAAADPAVAPEREAPTLATRTPLYRTPESEAEAGPEAEPEPGTKFGTKARLCAEGCNPLAWLGRMLAPRVDAAEAAENTNAASTAPPEETAAPVATDQADEAPCGAGESAPKPAVAPVDSADGADDTDALCAIAAEAQETATPAPVAAVAPITPSMAAAIPCEADEADGATDVPAPGDVEMLCADPASVDEIAAAEAAPAGDEQPTTTADTRTSEDTPPAADSTSPTSAPLLPPPPAPDALRTGEVVGRIWIAPFVDAGGVYREGAWVRAVLAPAEWRRR